MKNGFKILVAGLALLASAQLISCKKEKKEDPSIVGTWQSKSLSSLEKENGVTIFDTTLLITTTTVTFKSDNTYTTVDAADATNNESGTYSISGSKLFITPTAGDKDSLDYQVTATELTFSDYFTSTTAGIKYEYLGTSKFNRK
jgi:hypothetical protein